MIRQRPANMVMFEWMCRFSRNWAGSRFRFFGDCGNRWIAKKRFPVVASASQMALWSQRCECSMFGVGGRDFRSCWGSLGRLCVQFLLGSRCPSTSRNRWCRTWSLLAIHQMVRRVGFCLGVRFVDLGVVQQLIFDVSSERPHGNAH